MKKTLKGRARRKVRIRNKINGTEARPRLSVFRSAKHIYAQVVDDAAGATLVARSTQGAELISTEGDKTARAKAVGLAVAKACVERGISTVVFDRNGFIYHGRLQALADGAREGGLVF